MNFPQASRDIVLYDELIPGMKWLLGQLDLPLETIILPDVTQGQVQLDAETCSRVKGIFIRSTTRVCDAFLNNFPSLHFLATATSGIDHVDLEAVQGRGVHFVDAKGSNAKSVADYLLMTLAALKQKGINFIDADATIVGYGQVGHRVKQGLANAGVDAYWCDPFLKDADITAEEQCSRRIMSDEVEPWLGSTGLLCIHTPLRRQTPWPTAQWLNHDRLAALPDGAVILAAGRGETLVADAILQHAQRLHFILDVWPNEPQIDRCLLDHIRIATPHIAGHSRLGKLKGSWQVYEAFCRWLQIDLPMPSSQFFQFMLDGETGHLDVPVVKETIQTSIHLLNQTLSAFPKSSGVDIFTHLDQKMKKVFRKTTSELESVAAFKQLRKNYIQHPELRWKKEE